jgi:hypothetical protein
VTISYWASFILSVILITFSVLSGCYAKSNIGIITMFVFCEQMFRYSVTKLHFIKKVDLHNICRILLLSGKMQPTLDNRHEKINTDQTILATPRAQDLSMGIEVLEL